MRSENVWLDSKSIQNIPRNFNNKFVNEREGITIRVFKYDLYCCSFQINVKKLTTTWQSFPSKQTMKNVKTLIKNNFDQELL